MRSLRLGLNMMRTPEPEMVDALSEPEGSELRYAPEAWVHADGRPDLCGTPDDLISDLRALEARVSST